MLFGNIFDDVRITPDYLGRCAEDVVDKLVQNNGANEYNSVLNPLAAAMIPFRSELGQVDTTFNIQVGKAATVDSFIIVFKKYMNDNYMKIAVALGNDKTTTSGGHYGFKWVVF